MTTFNTRVTFDHVRNSAAGFTSSNPVLGYGVTGLETDTGRIKVGDGVTPWNSLLYSTSAGLVEVNGFTSQSLLIQAGSNVTVSSSQGQVTISASGNVLSVNSKTGAVVLNATDVSAASAVHTHVAASVTDFATEAAKHGPVSSVAGRTGTITLTTADISDFNPDAYGKVSSVNGLTGTVTLVAASVSAASAVHTHVAADVTDFATEAAKYGPVTSVNGITGTPSVISGGGGITVTTSGSSIIITGTTAAGGGGGASAPVTVSVSTVTVSQNNWDIGEGDIFYLYSGSTNTLNVTGIATSTSTQQRLLVNESTHTSASFTIKHQDTNSTATLRLVVPWAGDYVVSPNGGAALLIRNAAGDRWRVV